MKTVFMLRDFSYRAAARVVVQYQAGNIYKRVPEAAVRAIAAAGVGEILDPVQPLPARVAASPFAEIES